MASYRMYFWTSGKIACREDFEADNNTAAISIARVLYETCSDVSDHFELWQGSRPVHDPYKPNPEKICLADLIESHQRIVVEKEETIRDSKWMIAESRRLIEALNGLLGARAIGR